VFLSAANLSWHIFSIIFRKYSGHFGLSQPTDFPKCPKIKQIPNLSGNMRIRKENFLILVVFSIIIYIIGNLWKNQAAQHIDFSLAKGCE